MFYVYVLKSAQKEYHYIGYTKDLRRRLKEHNNGKTKSIKHLIPFELVYYESYSTNSAARRREINLKKNSAAKKELFKQVGIV